MLQKRLVREDFSSTAGVPVPYEKQRTESQLTYQHLSALASSSVSHRLKPPTLQCGAGKGRMQEVWENLAWQDASAELAAKGTQWPEKGTGNLWRLLSCLWPLTEDSRVYTGGKCIPLPPSRAAACAGYVRTLAFCTTVETCPRAEHVDLRAVL